MKLIEQDKLLLTYSLEEDWFSYYEIIRNSGDLIDFSGLAAHPRLEESIARAITENNEDMMRLLLSRDRGVVTRYPALRNLEEVKKVHPHYLEAWKHSKCLQILDSIHKRVGQLVEEDPHQDFSGYLIRAARFPISDRQFKSVIEACLAKILHHSSLLGLEQTIASLQGYNQIMYTDAVLVLIWNPDYLDRAEHLWEQRLLTHEIIRQIIPVAKKLRFPAESIEWIEEHLKTPVPIDDDECPF